MKSEYRFYLFAGGCLALGSVLAYLRGEISIALIGLLFSVGSATLGQKSQQKVEEQREIARGLLEDKSDLKDEIERQRKQARSVSQEIQEEQERKSQLREEKKRMNQRLSNLKRALKRKGVDTEYLLDKYDSSLYAPLMVLTHFQAPKHNTEEDAKRITSNLKTLDTQMLHGATRIVPPRNFDQDISTKEDLQKWFDEQVLDGDPTLTHKLEAISIADVSKTFDRNQTVDNDGRGFVTNTISELFETDTIIPTEDLIEILARDKRVSLEDELRENIALLAVQSASENQMEQIIKSQSQLENDLGTLDQIAETDAERISEALRDVGVDDSNDLSNEVKNEAERLKDVLS